MSNPHFYSHPPSYTRFMVEKYTEAALLLVYSKLTHPLKGASSVSTWAPEICSFWVVWVIQAHVLHHNTLQKIHGSGSQMYSNWLQKQRNCVWHTAGQAPRRRRGKMCWNRQRRPQERHVESKPIRPEMDTNMVSFARPMGERFELPNWLILPQIPSTNSGWLKNYKVSVTYRSANTWIPACSREVNNLLSHLFHSYHRTILQSWKPDFPFSLTVLPKLLLPIAQPITITCTAPSIHQIPGFHGLVASLS